MIFFFLLCLGLCIGQGAINFKSTILDSPIDQVVWCGGSVVVTIDDDVVEQRDNIEKRKHDKILFIMTDRGNVYRSWDYGFNWENVSDVLIQRHRLGDKFKFKDMIQSPADSNVIYLQGSKGQSFRTTDCGSHINGFTHSEKLFGMRLNKMNSKQIIAYEEKTCNKSLANCRDQYKKQLVLSQDGGDNWNVILTQVKEANWDKLIHYEIVPDERIIASHLTQDGKIIVSYSNDFYKQYKIISTDAFGFHQTYRYLFLLVRPDEYTKGYDLDVQTAFTDVTNPMEIVLPIQDHTKHTFTILDASTDQIFLSVSHNEDLPKVTNIYTSSSGDVAQFAVSLLNNVRSIDTGSCDFQKINGIDGLYIANIYEFSEVEKMKSRRKRATTEKELKAYSLEHLDSYKKSVITYDQGADWHPIRAPKTDQDGNLLNCNGDCSLHFKSKSNQFSQIYSSNQAIGLVVAVGNTGLFLSQKDEDMNTYLSRDGGHNWYQILKGSHIYDIGDHGGLIVFAKNDRETDHVLYTWDEGLTFEKIKFTLQSNIQIDNIITEPSNLEQKFIIYGRQLSSKLGLQDQQDNPIFKGDTTTQLRGVIFAADFTSLHQRPCSGQWDPTMPESDYEYWTPINNQQQKCLLGKRTKYIRRKREAKCFNPEELEKIEIVQNCQCSEEDWECDLGYYRRVEGGECIPLTNKFKDAKEYNQVPANCTGTYMRSQGYRKIPGDTCEGGVDLGPIETICPDYESSQQKSSSSSTTKEIDNQIMSNNNFLESLQKNKGVVCFIIFLVFVILFKDKIFEIFKSPASNKKQNKRNYYPTTDDEEMKTGIRKGENL